MKSLHAGRDHDLTDVESACETATGRLVEPQHIDIA